MFRTSVEVYIYELKVILISFTIFTGPFYVTRIPDVARSEKGIKITPVTLSRIFDIETEGIHPCCILLNGQHLLLMGMTLKSRRRFKHA